MLRYLKTHFRDPEMTSYEYQQRKKTLTIVMWVAVYTSGLLAIVDLAVGARVSAWILLGAVPLCLGGVWLIKRDDHLHASLLLERGLSLRTLSDRLGHADPGFTLSTYTHAVPGGQEKAGRQQHPAQQPPEELWPQPRERVGHRGAGGFPAVGEQEHRGSTSRKVGRVPRRQSGKHGLNVGVGAGEHPGREHTERTLA
jgi:hypothetical protein